MGQQSREAIVKQRFSKEQMEAKDMEEVESGTRPDIASYILREDSLELQFLYVSQILNRPQFQIDNINFRRKVLMRILLSIILLSIILFYYYGMNQFLVSRTT